MASKVKALYYKPLMGNSPLYPKPRTLLFSVGLTVLLALGNISCREEKAQAGRGNPAAGKPVPVLAETAGTSSMPLELSTFGKVRAYSTATVKAQVTGVLTAVHFQKGQEVKKGELLFEIDSRPFQASLKQLEAGKAKNVAQLANARKELARQKELLEKHIASQADYDRVEADALTLEAGVQADDAAIENARLQVGYCTIVAPVDGRAGDRLVDPGNLVRANDMELVTINQIRPVEVYFSVPQRELPGVRKFQAAQPLRVRARVPGVEAPPEQGQLTFIDSSIDQATGTVRLGATFPNDHELLWPGLYVEVVLTLSIQENATVVPSQAIQTGREGQYVFVVSEKGPDQIAEIRLVKVRRAGKLTIVDAGLASGETVITDGQVRLLPGAKVVVKKDLLENQK